MSRSSRRGQEPKSPGAQEPRNAGAQEPRSPGALEFKSPRAQEPKSPRAQEPKSPRAQEPSNPGAQELRSPRAQLRSPRAQEPKSAGAQRQVPKTLRQPKALRGVQEPKSPEPKNPETPGLFRPPVHRLKNQIKKFSSTRPWLACKKIIPSGDYPVVFVFTRQTAFC